MKWISGKNNKLFAFDLDGTLFEKNFSLLKENIEIIEELKKRGHWVVIVTGRPWRDAIRVYQKLNLGTILASYNGALITYPGNDFFKDMKTTMSKTIIEELLKGLSTEKNFKSAFIDCGQITFTLNNFPNLDHDVFNKEYGELQFSRSPNAEIKNMEIEHFITADPYSVLLEVKSKDGADEIFNFVKREFGSALIPRIWSVPHNWDKGYIIEIQGIHANKGRTIEKLASYMNVPIKNTIAFGDGLNDLEMLVFSGKGVAMKNGSNTVRMFADDITKFTNEEAGVAKYIWNYLKKYD